MPKSRGRKTKSKPGKRSGGPHLRVVAGDSPVVPDVPETGPPTDAVLDSAVEALTSDLTDVDEDIAPVFAEAAIAQVLATIETALSDDADEATDAARYFWTDASRILAGRDDLGSGVLLAGLSRMAGRPGRLWLQRGWLARQRAWADRPAWVDRVADFGLTGAMVSTDVTGDGQSIVLDYADDTHPHTIVVFIDNNLGGMAKDVFVGPALKVVEETYVEGGGVEVGSVKPDVALGMILRGMAVTMETDEPPVAESFDFFAGLLMSRIQQLDLTPVFPPDEPELADRERAALVRDFAGSAFADRLGATESDIETIARLWIDHAVDYTVGGPLRVSPILVELFLADFVPRKVVADQDFLDLIPDVVTAWLRFAGAETDIDAATVAEAVDAVARWTPAMHARSGNPSAWGLDADLDPLEEAFLSLPGLGPAPFPDVRDLDEITAEVTTVIVRYAWMYTGDTLGTAYSMEGFDLAERFCRAVPDEILGRGQPLTWARACAWIVAHRHDMIGSGCLLSVKQLADELGSTPKTLRDKAKLITSVIE